MKVVTYKCDKCGKELTEWNVVGIDTNWRYQLREVSSCIPYDYHLDLCESCANKIWDMLKKE